MPRHRTPPPAFLPLRSLFYLDELDVEHGKPLDEEPDAEEGGGDVHDGEDDGDTGESRDEGGTPGAGGREVEDISDVAAGLGAAVDSDEVEVRRREEVGTENEQAAAGGHGVEQAQLPEPLSTSISRNNGSDKCPAGEGLFAGSQCRSAE